MRVGCQPWAAVPLQSQICRAVPSALLPPGRSRQRPDWGFRSEPLAWRAHVCAPVPLQVQSWTRVPLAVPLAETSRHLPSALRVWSVR